MGFVVLHMEKAHGSDSGTTAHIERFIIPKNADPTRTHLNRKLIEYPEGVKDRSAAIQRRLEGKYSINSPFHSKNVMLLL